jgi:Uma2 family endonuclease
MTVKDLACLSDEIRGYELVEGRLVKAMPTGGGHGTIGMKLGGRLELFVEEHHLGSVLSAETGFDLSQLGYPNTVLAPDLAFVRTERLPDRTSAEWDEYWQLAPDLVVEIASPTQYRPEMAAKARRWLVAGVRLIWVVWPRYRQVDVWRIGADDPVAVLSVGETLEGLDVVPGFACPVSRLFA